MNVFGKRLEMSTFIIQFHWWQKAPTCTSNTTKKFGFWFRFVIYNRVCNVPKTTKFSKSPNSIVLVFLGRKPKRSAQCVLYHKKVWYFDSNYISLCYQKLFLNFYNLASSHRKTRNNLRLKCPVERRVLQVRYEIETDLAVQFFL